MLQQLLESRSKKQSSAAGTTVSVVVHSTLIGAAAWATAHVTPRVTDPANPVIQYVATPAPTPLVHPKSAAAASNALTKAASTATSVSLASLRMAALSLTVPNVIPDIDVGSRSTQPSDFSGGGVRGGENGRGGVGNGIHGDGDAYLPGDVERIAALDVERSARPVYPAVLRDAGTNGVVRVQFVVDTVGRAEPGSLRILSSPNVLFSESVRRALPLMWFFPAQVNGHAVRQLVEQQFTFAIK